MVNLVVDEQGAPPLPWLAAPLADTLAHQRGHALLLHGAAGVGTLHFAVALAQSWLCEGHDGHPRPACGRCPSCHLVQSKLHPDLLVLMPETARQAHAWPFPGDKPEDEGKKKPSRQIRIDEIRHAIDWVARTTSRGRGKVVVLHPAEAINLQAANALLKTLEEPPAGTRLLLGAGDPQHMLPTVRSRCHRVALAAPPTEQARDWLAGQGVAEPEVLLAAAAGRPLDAQALAKDGVSAAAWRALPTALARGQAQAVSGWPVPRLVDALQKLCHDAAAVGAGAGPRYFPAGSVPRARSPQALHDWHQALQRVARHDEHPWHEPLLVDALVAQASAALTLRG
ncbi:DNA polymerase-3 subunit delta' [Rubrivivax gelatinosus]|uniref:DNA polymerase-3 subunit delta n=1 Tax=Rubrivivax gelatinosus TaxID=28068 RepID=A0A4R2MIC9_RUBGE|nr:DNA polymerase III subunit delta' [Rubrivivax gelatinosus]MBK1686344.1 DNA polymerase III subunit delta' [Rubrivivax gelatinosus]TCP04434.1 DNA polymerase-3 subunit delta' [Rubrivivax gelatinosus]